MHRRTLLAATAAAAAATLGLPARAQAYPNRPVKIILGLAPGASTDAGTRLLAQHLQEVTGQTFVVENRPGAGSTIGAAAVASAPADGYTLFMGTGSYATSAALYPNLSFDPVKSFKPITQLNRFPSAIGVDAKSDIKSLPQLIEMAKAKPGTISFASTGHGGQTHFAGELFQQITGTKLIHVPYKGGGPALQDVIAGRVPLIFVDLFTLLPHWRQGTVRILAVTGNKRADAAPDIPTAQEQGVRGFEVVAWLGLFAPAGTPDSVVEYIHKAVATVGKREAFIKRMADSGAEVVASTPAEFSQFFQKEVDLYKRVAQAAHIKLE
ncbi:Bug family tripartite tricarboxylate transporter substrate binding protein [Ramlibacter albus]|uniref:Tripartite tricarboxylate transporter substrate binding protein n=1 Tax=Ramlibacter albus TaxID=2079448 RepID=A0A923S4U4_9BURK|nr:tripartite tricarboxylate transporter substrate binding protein [Ramlibacter albus]MBC5767885.1 tripartite tricarboxylate transporter substrate binding protein [Ramlibacter albus]